MSSGKRIFIRFAGGILVFLILLATLIFLLPLLSRQEWTRDKVAGKVSNKAEVSGSRNVAIGAGSTANVGSISVE